MSRRSIEASNSLSAKVIDSLELARNGGRIEGKTAVAEFPRVRAETDGVGAIEYRVSGERDDEGRFFLTVQMAGHLQLRCQRCLQPMPWELAVSNRLHLVAPDAAWPDDELTDDDCDAVVAEKEQSLLDLLEDELILALPIAPRHEECERPAMEREGNEASPFAALAKLKKS